MDYRDAIEMLKSMQSPEQDYAESIGAPGHMYGIRCIYPDPEDYAIEYAIMALQMQIKMQEYCDNHPCCVGCEYRSLQNGSVCMNDFII